ncbi:hypothetical protein HMPREF9440_01832 [Sutterella parvirubra YIT 11816]|uniref:Uncharacterized protein n=1 Tax=Sutterella parvirubra YIT 11816 TaxID=762967 RepID=H3KGF2_9BURK|nr:hypothetical protein HMPREF9440_01832 [Sutterella parvirubra YIT 11816]
MRDLLGSGPRISVATRAPGLHLGGDFENRGDDGRHPDQACGCVEFEKGRRS